MKKRNSGGRIIVLALAVIIIFGLVPRAVELLNGNYLFGYDQGLFYEKVKRIVVERKLTLIGEEVGGRGGFFQGPGFYYLLSIPFTLFKGDPYGGVVLMFILGAATLILAAILAKKLLGSTEALFITLLLSGSPAMIAQSRFVWNPFVVPLIYLIILFLFYKVLTKQERFVPYLMFTIGLLFHFEIATGIMVLGEFMFFLTLLLWKRYFRFIALIYGLGAFVLTQLSFIIFDLRHNFLITKGLWNTAFGKAPHAITRTYVEHMLLNHFEVFRNNFFSTFPWGGNLWPIFLLLGGAALCFLYTDRSAPKTLKLFVGFLLAGPVVIFLLYMKYLWPIWEWWLLELLVTYCVLFGILFAVLWRRSRMGRLGLTILIFIFASLQVKDIYKFYTTDFFDYGGVHKIRGKLEAIDAVYQDASGRPFGLLVFTPPTYTYAYDYLLWWYGRKKYGYLPPKEKQGLYYLLIEPDPQKPWTYQGWLETVIEDGEVLSRWQLPSGFIIEKRKG